MSRSASKKEREPMSGVETVCMVIIFGCISVNLLDMKDNKYYMSPECSEEDMPLVTIITPTYNSNPQYLKEAIESVLEQTYPKIEYIITDDGSSVFHDELIHELLETKNRGNVIWKIIRHGVNVGTVKNMNGAIRESHGEYIFGLAHDDLLYDSAVISKRVKHFLETSALITVGYLEVCDSKLLPLGKLLPSPRNAMKIQHLSPSKLYLELAFKNYIPGSSLAQSRICFDTYGLYDENFQLVEDWPRIMKLLENNIQIYLWDGLSVKYRTSSGGVSSGNTDNLIFLHDSLRFQSILLNKLPFVYKLLVFLPYCSLRMYYKSLSYLGMHGGVNMSQMSLRKIYELSKYYIFVIIRNLVR